MSMCYTKISLDVFYVKGLYTMQRLISIFILVPFRPVDFPIFFLLLINFTDNLTQYRYLLQVQCIRCLLW